MAQVCVSPSLFSVWKARVIRFSISAPDATNRNPSESTIQRTEPSRAPRTIRIASSRVR